MSVPVLTILDGLQAGSRTRLAMGGSLVGTGTDCAVVIADPAMRSDHFEVLVGDATVLHALSPVLLPDGSSVAAGSRYFLSGSTAFTAGKTRFLIEMPVADAAAAQVVATPRRLRTRFAVWGMAAAAGGALVGGAWLAERGHDARQPRSAAAAVLMPHHPVTGGIDRAAAAAALQARVAAAGLAGVSVGLQPDGTLVASGLLGVGDEAAWSAVRQWFDASYDNNVVVVERFGTPGALPPLRIAAVWFGANPYVVTDQGDRLHAGASVGEGWFVDGFTDGHVVVRRGSQTIALRYAP